MSYVKTPLALDAPFSLQPDFIAASVNVLVQQCHGANVKAGWWTFMEKKDSLMAVNAESLVKESVAEKIQQWKRDRNVPELLMLTVSELSEAMEGDRKNLKDDKLPQYDMLAVELADAIIRICDLAGAKNYPLGEILAAKMKFNAVREDHTLTHRAGPSGKQY